MKINLPFHCHSVIKKITTACLLIVIVSAMQIISVFITFDSHLANIKKIDKVSILKISTSNLIYATQHNPKNMPYIIQEIGSQLTTKSLFKGVWFSAQQDQTLVNQWHEIHQKIKKNKFSEAEILLHQFVISLNEGIKHYQVLASQKIHIIYITVLINFLIIIMITFIVYFYAKKYIIKPIEDVSTQTIASKKEQQRIDFLYFIAQQLNSVKLTSAILYGALNALTKQANLQKLCLELNNGTLISSEQGNIKIDEQVLRVPIMVNNQRSGFLNYVTIKNTEAQHTLIERFSALVAQALYQEEYNLQAQKVLLMEERRIISRELHDSIAQSLSFLKIQCMLLRRQINNTQLAQTQHTIAAIEEVLSDAYLQLRSLLSTFRLSAPESNFKEAMQSIIKTLQKQTSAVITMKKFETLFYIDASQHIHLLQIIREAIINAIKHSQCGCIDISCIITEQHDVWISIIDDGLGIIKNNEQHHHYGLSIMQQRADELGATLLFNHLSRGTEVKLIFPYKNPTLNQGTTNV